jgi:hypothetical protein
MDNVATYSEARSEYTKQLATFIVPAIVTWFQQLWHRNANNRSHCLALFQTECEEVARWNQDRIHDEVRVLIERSGCDYMDLLVSAVFVAHTKVLTAVRLSQKQKQLSIDVPKLDHFIHRIFRESARSFWKAPFLFMDAGSVVERQKNLLQIEALAAEAITTAVRGLLPVKKILADYLDGDAEEIEDDAMATQHLPAASVAIPEKEEEEEEVKPAPTPVPTPAPAPALAVAEVEEKASEGVKFSDYDTVFDDKQPAPELRYTPKENAGDEADESIDDLDILPADGVLQIDEESASNLGDDDVEELEPPVKPVPAPPNRPSLGVPKAPVSENLDDEEMIVLD